MGVSGGDYPCARDDDDLEAKFVAHRRTAMNTIGGRAKAGLAALGCIAALTILPAGVANAAASDTSPSCPGAYQCIQPGADPNVPYGTDPSVPYGPEAANSRPQTGAGSGSYLGGGV